MAIRETTWQPAPHTLAKLEILRNYLQAWFPIMSRYNGRILYIDGFAGPGKYLDDKNEPSTDGSPLIAIKAAVNHKFDFKAEVVFIFVDTRQDRCDYLKNLTSKMTLPDNMRFEIHCCTFDEQLTDILNYLDEQGKAIAPAFVFIDPFGYSDTPFSLIKRIMTNPKCEVLINFMCGHINRFINDPDKADHFDVLFGTNEWRSIVLVADTEERREKLCRLYRQQLKEVAEIKYVRYFEMINRFNQTAYFLFFGTNHISGLKAMLGAMWNVDPGGDFKFSDLTNPNQTLLFQPNPNYDLLQKLIVAQYKGKVVSIEDLKEFVLLSGFRETHYKKQILIPMEKANPPQIEVVSKRKRKCSYPEGIHIKFL